jgi:hypothetical protein
MKKQKKQTKNNKKTINKDLSKILEKRTGGAIAIKGFNFQFLYACFIILDELSKENIKNSIRLEGIEDIDICHKNEFIQLKSSKNAIDASKFWKMDVLKNYLEVYQIKPSCHFRFVHDTTIAKGNLKALETQQLKRETLEYWNAKIQQLPNIKDINIQEFLQKITFKKVKKEQIFMRCKQLLVEKFDLNSGTEEQFLFALLQHVSTWSEERKVVDYNDVLQVIQLVQDASSKTPTNEAIKKNLITHVSFEITEETTDLGYFDGKSAKPIHIALGLPVEREYWQKSIRDSLEEYGVTVIKSSSGQGKSTLAWKVAYDFKKLGFDIYQLNYAETYESIEEIFDFIEARIQIGQLPLIVIDGLDKKVEKWDDLVERLFNLPVKVVVTTREEDWYRYGLDASKVQLNTVNIYLNHDEAKKIFEQLKIKNKLHEDIKTWEPIWEKIESKGLLIEYVYLLTHGKMIYERLEQQIKQLNNDKNDVKAKIEILRIIALADILNIRIQTKKLTKYIQDSIGFQSDRGELYKKLEKEYYLQFDKKYIEGLHPVRSQHLVDILHQTIPIEESLIILLDLVDDDLIYDYFASAPFLVKDKDDFSKESARILKDKSFKTIVDAIDGLMHFEPYSYWKNNREIYDDVFNKGLINPFVNFNPPFSDIQTLEEINKIVKTDSSEYMVNQKNKLITFSFKEAFVSKFCLYISEQLAKLRFEQTKGYNGLAYLAKWLQITKAPIPLLIDFEDDLLLQELKEKDLKEVMELYIFFYILYPQEYLTFIRKHNFMLFSILKEKTNSISIYEKNNELYIKYLADYENMDKLNEYSIERIDIFKNIFPYYERFNAEAIYLPFPNEEFYRLMIQNSIKRIPKENLMDKFDIHLNVIWRKTIMRQYSYESVYEWQEHHIETRNKILEFIKIFNKAFENILEGKKPKDFGNIEHEINLLLSLDKEFVFNQEEKFKEQLENISSFKTSFNNFISQLIYIIEDKFSQKSNLALLNFKDASFKLLSMQKSFQIITDNTYQYFETEELITQELYWFDRFIKTISFYMYSSEQKVIVAKDSIYRWWEEIHKNELNQIYDILQNLDYHIYKPIKVIEQANSKEIVIGIEGFEEGDLEQVLFGLVDFYKLGIDFVNIIRVHNKEASYGFRVPKMFFEKVQNELDGGEYEESEFGNPHPINVTDELLSTLDEKIVLESPPEDIPKTAFIEIMFDIWKLMEYRNNLDKNNEIENKWLQENKKNIIHSIGEKLEELNSNEQIFISQIIDAERDISKDEIIDLMNKKIGLYEEQS